MFNPTAFALGRTQRDLKEDSGPAPAPAFPDPEFGGFVPLPSQRTARAVISDRAHEFLAEASRRHQARLKRQHQYGEEEEGEDSGAYYYPQ